MRVNARLDDDHARKLDELCRRTGSSRTTVLRTAIERYYAEITAAPRRAAEILNQTGFVGCSEADAELASDYKAHLSDSLATKHDHR
jgi:predicted transcriptional regulator